MMPATIHWADMRLVDTMMRTWLTHPFRVAMVDDQQSWRGIKAWAAARHMARVIEQSSGQPRIGVLDDVFQLIACEQVVQRHHGATQQPGGGECGHRGA